MKKSFIKLPIILFALVASSCGAPANPSTSSDSKDTSVTSDISEDTSITSDGSEVTSTTSDSTPSEPLISLFSKTSKVYTKSLTKDVFDLKTYHHKNFGDVPFIDFAEFQIVFDKVSEHTRTFKKINDDNYEYISSDEKGKFSFDTKNDSLTVTGFNSFMDAIGINNGIYGCISQNSVSLYKGSEKTEYIQKGRDITINLKDYGFDLVSEEGHLYMSIGTINALLMPLIYNGIAYNGKDFFLNTCMRDFNVSVFARSGNFGFSWPLSSSECPTAFKKVDNKLTNETYRFEGLAGHRDDRKDIVSISLYKDGTGSLRGSGTTMIYKVIKWKIEDDIIKMVADQCGYETTDMEDGLGSPVDVWINTKETDYAKKTRSNYLSAENYRELCLTFDHFYGLKAEKNIESFDKYFTDKNLKERLLSNNIMEYEDAFVEFIEKDIDDIHSSVSGGENIYSSSEIQSYISNKCDSYRGSRYKAYYQEINELGVLRSKTKFTDSYIVEGNTAYLSFKIFVHDEKNTHPINHQDYQTENHEAAVKAYANAVQANPYKAFALAFNDFGKMNNIKNVVIDVTGNIGGEIRCAPYLAAFMTGDPSVVTRNQFDGSIVDWHYKVNLNGDDTYGGEGDTFAGKYNFYIMSGANFSAGNEFTTMAKINGFAKIIGRKSAGGSCAITPKNDINGLTYRASSMITLMAKDNDKYIANDNGIEPDLTVPFDNMYDLTQLDAWLNTLN